MPKRRIKNGASTIEYAVLIILLVSAFLLSQNYIRRALSGNMRQMADTFGFGKQYEEGKMIAPGWTCIADTDCGGTLFCVGNQCVECRNDTDCQPYVCSSSNVCVQCRDAAGCPPGQDCVNNSCEEKCLNAGEGWCPAISCCPGLTCNTALHTCY